MRVLAFDLETIPQSSHMAELVCDVDPLHERLMDSSPITKSEAEALVEPFTRSGVKGFAIGNRSKPEALREHLQAAVAGHLAATSKRCSLDPMLGRVCAVGFATAMPDGPDGPDSVGEVVGLAKTLGDFLRPPEERDAFMVEDDGAVDEAEAELLRWAWDILAQCDCVVSWNGFGFDAPFLLVRSALLGIRPSRNIAGRRYSNVPHCDLMQWLAGWDRQKWRSLTEACRLAGVGTPKDHMDGSQVASYADDGRWDEIRAYCLADVVDRTWPLYRVFRPVIQGHEPPVLRGSQTTHEKTTGDAAAAARRKAG